MVSALVFLDCETTGLSLDDDIWEFAAIRREPDGTQTEHHLFIDHDPEKCAALPESFRDDHCSRYRDDEAVTQEAAARYINALLTDRPHVVGAIPNFDTERLGLLLRTYGHTPGWDYHLIDVENLTVGYLAATGAAPTLPWDSNTISAACGVEPPTNGRHTAMGDTRWAMALYDRIIGTPR